MDSETCFIVVKPQKLIIVRVRIQAQKITQCDYNCVKCAKSQISGEES